MTTLFPSDQRGTWKRSDGGDDDDRDGAGIDWQPLVEREKKETCGRVFRCGWGDEHVCDQRPGHPEGECGAWVYPQSAFLPPVSVFEFPDVRSFAGATKQLLHSRYFRPLARDAVMAVVPLFGAVWLATVGGEPIISIPLWVYSAYRGLVLFVKAEMLPSPEQQALRESVPEEREWVAEHPRHGKDDGEWYPLKGERLGGGRVPRVLCVKHRWIEEEQEEEASVRYCGRCGTTEGWVRFTKLLGTG